ncbi:hypothetical protein [Buttiauxella gaviniae]|uniref:hypothetical protein n=1 Tax=Buttiauxella gaviniae TaxID=82990 RepID=UPI0039B062CB
MEKINYEALMSDGAQKNIKDGLWKVIGMTVQDTSNGRIVANFKTVLSNSDSGYTPAMFMSMKDEIIFAQRIISEQARLEFIKLSAGQTRIEEKIEHLTELQYGQLQGEFLHFFSQFEHLRVGQTAVADRLLESGGNLASRVSGIVDAMISNYLGQVELSYDNNRITYSVFCGLDKKRSQYFKVYDLTYPDFQNSWCRVFVGGLIEMFNQLNIVSVCFNQELFMDYKQSLTALKIKLTKLLNHLVWGVDMPQGIWESSKHSFDNYRTQVFSTDFNGNWIRGNEAARLEKFWDSFGHESLATAHFPKAQSYGDKPKRDPALYQAVTIVLDFIEHIDDLICRGTQLEDGGINDNEALNMLTNKVFRASKT